MSCTNPHPTNPTHPQVKGYRRIVFCQAVRDDVDGALGAGAWADLLPRMCEGRLVPTPWLNKVGAARGREALLAAMPRDPLPCLACTEQQPAPAHSPRRSLTLSHLPRRTARPPHQDFREPLYLLDRPVRLADTRTEEERRYPELFRWGACSAPGDARHGRRGCLQGAPVSRCAGGACLPSRRRTPCATATPATTTPLRRRAKLEAEGWSVPASVSTVPIPGVNMPKDADWRTYGLEQPARA